MSRNSHGVILLFWMGERLIVTFGRQVYGQLLDHLIVCPFCMAVAVSVSSLWPSCILQGQSDGDLARAAQLTHMLPLFWLVNVRKVMAPGCLLSCKRRHLHQSASSSPCMPFPVWAHMHSLPRAGRTFFPHDTWGHVVDPRPFSINRRLFSSRICMQPQLTRTPV